MVHNAIKLYMMALAERHKYDPKIDIKQHNTELTPLDTKSRWKALLLQENNKSIEKDTATNQLVYLESSLMQFYGIQSRKDLYKIFFTAENAYYNENVDHPLQIKDMDFSQDLGLSNINLELTLPEPDEKESINDDDINVADMDMNGINPIDMD